MAYYVVAKCAIPNDTVKIHGIASTHPSSSSARMPSNAKIPINDASTTRLYTSRKGN